MSVMLDYADNYFSTLSFDTEDWDAYDDTAKEKALNVAAELLNRLPLVSPIPDNDDIKKAKCEIALALSKDNNIETLAEGTGILSDTYGSIKTVYRDSVQEWLTLGIPSFKAYQYLKPYLVRNTTVSLTRID